MDIGLPFAVLGFVGALLLLVLGHLVRVMRWSVLLRQIGTPWSASGFLALSLAYVLNAFVPLRLGELARGAYYASRTRSDIAYVLATVVVERAFDLAVVWALVVLFVGLGWFDGVPLWPWTLGMLVGTGGVVATALAVEHSARMRYAIWLVASVFNPRIRLVLLDGAWSLPEVLHEARAHWGRVLSQTAAMWALYLASYWLLAAAQGVGFQSLFEVIHGAPLTPAVLSFLREGPRPALVLSAYTFAPFALVLAYSAASARFGVSVRGAISWLAEPLLYVHRLPRARSRFTEAEQYGGFLVRRFSGAANLVSDFESNAIGDAIVVRLFRGGSDALTALVQVGDELRIRKYALGDAAAKLEAQCEWLRRHGDALPLVEITHRARTASRFYYDMAYSERSRDLFDAIHSSELAASWGVLEQVLESVRRLHAETANGTASAECVTRYAAEKVLANLRLIQASFPLFFEQPSVRVNGVPIDLRLLERIAEPDFLPSRLALRQVGVIHGDLTIENIIANAASPNGWFLIDPNVGNVLESPLLDYAKLLQSLHLGYESLNRDVTCAFGEGELTFPIARTAQYAVLYERTIGWMRDRFGDESVREARLHEIVHYFRLTPYKFRKSTQAGLVFLGCLGLLAERYFADYERC